jgi:hypothetical protein
MRAALIAASALALGACNMVAEAQETGGDGRPDRRSFDVGSFDSVSLGGYQNVVVAVGPAASVRAEGPSSELDRLEIDVDDGDLRIRTKRDGWRMSMGKRQPVTIYVTTPRLTSAALGGSGDMRIDRVEGNSFKAAIGGSGDISIASLRVGSADFSIGGSGGISASGEASRQAFSIAGSGNIDAAGLRGRTAEVSIVGSGDVRANASETASVTIMGSGDVELSGGAKCDVTKRGSGSVRCTG